MCLTASGISRMNNSSSNLVYFSYLQLEHIRETINSYVIKIFLSQWQRIIKLDEAYVVTKSSLPDDINRIQNNYFWAILVTEILDNRTYSISRVSEETLASPELIYQLKWDRPANVKMPLAVGEKLLLLHEKAQPHLQTVNIEEVEF